MLFKIKSKYTCGQCLVVFYICERRRWKMQPHVIRSNRGGRYDGVGSLLKYCLPSLWHCGAMAWFDGNKQQTREIRLVRYSSFVSRISNILINAFASSYHICMSVWTYHISLGPSRVNDQPIRPKSDSGPPSAICIYINFLMMFLNWDHIATK